MSEQKVVIELQYFPSIAWFALGLGQGSLYLDLSENYNKRSLRNKAILFESQHPVILSVPLQKGKHSGTNICDVKISHDADWQNKHIRAINACYGKSPYFIHYAEDVHRLILDGEESLVKFNKRIIEELVKLLNLDMVFYDQMEFINSTREDWVVLRDGIRYSKELTTLEKQMTKRMAKMEGETHLPFQPSPRNSILDLMFHLGPETRLYLNEINQMDEI